MAGTLAPVPGGGIPLPAGLDDPVDTTRQPLYFSAVLAELTCLTFDRLRGCFWATIVSQLLRAHHDRDL